MFVIKCSIRDNPLRYFSFALPVESYAVMRLVRVFEKLNRIELKRIEWKFFNCNRKKQMWIFIKNTLQYFQLADDFHACFGVFCFSNKIRCMMKRPTIANNQSYSKRFLSKFDYYESSWIMDKYHRKIRSIHW